MTMMMRRMAITRTIVLSGMMNWLGWGWGQTAGNVTVYGGAGVSMIFGVDSWW